MILLAAVPLLTQVAIVAVFWLWARRIDARPTVRLLAALVGGSAAIVLLQIGLGFFGVLGPRTLGAAVALLFVPLAGSAFLARDREAGPVDPKARIAPPTPVGAVLAGITLVAWLAIAGACALVPPWGWDALTYHLTQVFEIARTGSLKPLAYPAHWMFFPLVGELHSSFWVLLSGAGPESWRLAGLAQAPLALTAGVAARALAEAIGLRAGLPWIVPGLMLTPVVLIQTASGYVDVASAAFTLAALAFAALALAGATFPLAGARLPLAGAPIDNPTPGGGRFPLLALCLLSAGLAFGVKIAFAVFVVPLVLILTARGAMDCWKQALAGRAFVRVALFAACLSAGCGYWWVRNAVQTGNPLYPARVRIGKAVIFEGPQNLEDKTAQELWFVSGRAEWLRYPFYETFHGRPSWSLENGFGPLFAAGLAATLAALWLAWRARESLSVRVLLALPVALLLFHIAHLAEPRYVIAVCGLALVGLAALAERFDGGAAGRWSLRALHGAVIAGCLYTAAGGTASAAPNLDTAVRAWSAGQWRPESYYPTEYAHAGEAFNWISDNSGAGRTVTMTNGAFLAPLYGWAGKNRVVYARAPGDLPIETPWRASTAVEWRAFLLREHVDWVVVWVPWWDETRTDPAEQWIQENPAAFETLADFGRARILKPVFTAAERVALGSVAPGAPGVARFDDAANWTVEYAEGAAARVTAASPAGAGPGAVRVDYELQTAGNDYADLRIAVDEGDWSGARALSFDLEASAAPAWLYVYVKDRDTAKSARFKIDLSAAPAAGPAGPRRITLEFNEAETRSWLFSWARVAEVHFVIDDAREEDLARGSLTLGRFRLDAAERTPGESDL